MSTWPNLTEITFLFFPLAAAAQFSAHDAAIDNKRKTTENLRSESVSEYP